MPCHTSRNKPNCETLAPDFFRTPYSDANIVFANTLFQGEKTLKNVFLTLVDNYEVTYYYSNHCKGGFLQIGVNSSKNIFFRMINAENVIAITSEFV
jgi:hypothetical protein